MTKIQITPEEIDNVTSYIKNKMKKIGRNSITVDKEKILNIVADDEWKNNPDKEDKLKERAFNRIRFYMLNELNKNGIEVEYKGDQYIFSKEKENENKDNDDNEDNDNDDNNDDDTITDKEPIKTFSNFNNEYVPHRQLEDVLKAIKYNERPLLVGPKGTGKSRLLEEVAAKLGLQHIRIALGQVSDPADLIGTKEIVEQNGVSITKYVHGLLTEAAVKGHMVILDEIDSVQPQVGLALHAVFESTNKIVCPTEKGAEVINVHPEFRIAATANTWGYGDDSGFYAGVEIQNRATFDRLRPKVYIGYDPETEQILLKKLITDKYADFIIQILYDQKNGIVKNIRNSMENEDIYDECSMRSIIAFAKHYQIYGYHKAMYYFINEFKPEYRETIQEMLATSWGLWAKGSVNDYDSNKENYIKHLKEDFEEFWVDEDV
mgnify:CR=1 FL=1